MEDTIDSPAKKESDKLPETDSPKRFFQEFIDSSTYDQAYKKFYSGKVVSPKVTVKDKQDVFNDGDVAKIALIDFHKNELNFSYNPKKMSKSTPELRDAIDKYVKYVKFIERTADSQRLTPEMIVQRDGRRRELHQEAAKRAAELGVAPSQKLGEGLVCVVLLNEDLISEEEAKELTFEKIQRSIA